MEIQIQRQAGRCKGCDRPFVNDQKQYSLLKIERLDFLREDYCEACWQERVQSVADDAYSRWETRYRDPAVARATPEGQFKPLLDLCYESIALDGAEGEAMAYLCSLLLRRQKVFRFLREEKEMTGGKRTVLVFADKYNDTHLRIVEPGLTEAQLKDTREKLETRLGYSKGDANDRQERIAR